MSYFDVLIVVEAYPFEAPDGVWPRAAAVAKALGGQAAALAFDLRITPPRNRFARILLSLDAVAEEEEARSRASARRALGLLEEAAKAVGLPLETRILPIHIYDEAQTMARHARTRDVCLLPVGPTLAGDLETAEALAFNSGRPLIVFPELGSPITDFSKIAVAWDGSRTAARALADALPLLRAAREVRLVSVCHDKTTPPELAPSAVQRHLARHDVIAVVDTLTSNGQSDAERLRTYYVDKELDLMVMGAFGHSRAKEFILGGVTAAMMAAPPGPMLMAH